MKTLLRAVHLEMFARLKIGPELLERAGVVSVTDAEARDKYGMTGYGDFSGVVFPYFDPLNGKRATASVRRDNPDIENGKPKKKYLCPYGDRRHLYFVPGCGEHIKDATIPILLVEAEKSVLAITAWADRTGQKILPVGLGGAWGWHGRIGKVENAQGKRVDEVGPLPDLSICKSGRKVYVLLDANASSNTAVQQARAALAQQLRKQKADVRILELPATDGVNGPDDYVAVCGDEAMANLFTTAEGGTAILNQVKAFIRRYVVATDAEITLMSVWVLHTYTFTGQVYTPYFSITSAEKQCGKSRLLEVLGFLVHRKWKCDSASPAALYRKIDKEKPTLLLDEADAIFKGNPEMGQAIRGVLNSGNHYLGSVTRCAGEGSNQRAVDYSTFCPKAIAGIGMLPDTVADRSIPIRLQRKMRDESVERLRERNVAPEAAALRKQIEEWAEQHNQTLLTTEPALPPELSDRQMDAIEPLLAIADEVGGGWPEHVRQAALEVFSGKSAEDQSIGVQLLADIRAVFDAKSVDRITSEDLAKALVEMEDRPWPEFGKSQKPITKTAMGRLLSRKYGVGPRKVRFGDYTLQGYEFAWFTDAFSRYLPPTPASEVEHVEQVNVHAGPSHFSEAEHGGFVPDVKSEESPMFVRVVPRVPDEKQGEGEGPVKTKRIEVISL